MYGIKKGQLGEEEDKVVVFFPLMFVLGGSVRQQQKHFLSLPLIFQKKTVVVFLVGLD